MMGKDEKELERLSELAYPSDSVEPSFVSIEDLQVAVDLAVRYMARYNNLGQFLAGLSEVSLNGKEES
ncbi:hypothetical protein LIZ91_03035 [Enterococcus avium]|uniref:hypothetical protein n=1 Tax=Enterococcus avium TaxID=33945 RepID=UPI001D0689AF|nr:hypothetical protein [Enterococcus avium]MCB6915552.1 hypothetical protein [Enterococcus avium]MCQ4959586.1 hypothetical protein [Enterococcus avium]